MTFGEPALMAGLTALRAPPALLCLAGLACMACLLVAAAITDFRHRRIPNRLVAAGALSAAMQQSLLPPGLHPAVGPAFGAPGLAAGAAAAALMLLAAGGLWRLGLWGAGDAKWLTVLAAHAGPGQVGPLLMLTAMAGGALAVGWKLARQPNPMPYAWAIAAGEVALVISLGSAAPDG